MPTLPPSLIADLETRQDEALAALDELERRLLQVLAEFGGAAVKPEAKPRLFKLEQDSVAAESGAEKAA